MERSIQGWTQAQIAAELGISQPAVSRILRRVERQQLSELLEDVERQRVRHTFRLNYIYGEALQAWERSKVGTTRRRQRRTQGGVQNTATVAELVVDHEHGDPRYLETARRALADLMKLWGLDTPPVIDHSMPHLSHLTDEELHEEVLTLARDSFERLPRGRRSRLEITVVPKHAPRPAAPESTAPDGHVSCPDPAGAPGAG